MTSAPTRRWRPSETPAARRGEGGARVRRAGGEGESRGTRRGRAGRNGTGERQSEGQHLGKRRQEGRPHRAGLRAGQRRRGWAGAGRLRQPPSSELRPPPAALYRGGRGAGEGGARRGQTARGADASCQGSAQVTGVSSHVCLLKRPPLTPRPAWMWPTTLPPQRAPPRGQAAPASPR